MYAILITIMAAIYSIILVDFSILFQDISVNADVIASTQAFYTAEGVIEKALKESKGGHPADSVKKFLEAKDNLKISDDYFSDYNLGAEAGYFNLSLGLSESDLMAAEGFDQNNQAVKEGVYLASGTALDEKSIYGLEPRSFKTFAIREVENQNTFNEIIFEYNRRSESSKVLLEIFAFPANGTSIDFQDFTQQKNNPENNVINRVVINTKDSSLDGKTFSFPNGQNFNVKFDAGIGDYKNRIIVNGFQPTGINQKNYLIQFQTLDNNPVHYKLSAFNQGNAVVLPNHMQTLDVIGATTNGLFQRVKFQRETEEGILPGLNFAHFSNQSIRK